MLRIWHKNDQLRFIVVLRETFSVPKLDIINCCVNAVKSLKYFIVGCQKFPLCLMLHCRLDRIRSTNQVVALCRLRMIYLAKAFYVLFCSKNEKNCFEIGNKSSQFVTPPNEQNWDFLSCWDLGEHHTSLPKLTWNWHSKNVKKR